MQNQAKTPGAQSKPEIVDGGKYVRYQNKHYVITDITASGVWVDASCFTGKFGDYISGDQF